MSPWYALHSCSLHEASKLLFCSWIRKENVIVCQNYNADYDLLVLILWCISCLNVTPTLSLLLDIECNLYLSNRSEVLVENRCYNFAFQGLYNIVGILSNRLGNHVWKLPMSLSTAMWQNTMFTFLKDWIIICLLKMLPVAFLFHYLLQPTFSMCQLQRLANINWLMISVF